MKSSIIKRLTACFIAAIVSALVLFPFGAALAERAEVASRVASMTTEDKLCQMLVLNFGTGTDSAGHQALSSAARQALGRHCFGGVFFYADNLSENEYAVRLIDAIQSANASGGADRPQLLFAADQEGGSITRIGHGTQTPGNMALGAINDAAAAWSVGSLIGSELSALGVSVDFAPVLDVNSNPSNPVIGIRSFSDSARTVASLGVGYLNGLRSTGTIGCLKHFPGHGDTATDSHTGLPCINKTYQQLKNSELIPFQRAIDAGAEMVMTAHIQFPNIETETYYSPISGQTITLPATLSSRIVTEILRGDMGFRGVVITDGMAMQALTAHFSPLEASRLAIEAGVDLLLSPVSPHNQSGMYALEELISSLVQMADGGRLSMAKINAAVTRILTLKQRHGLLGRYSSSDLAARIQNALRTVGSDAHHAAEWAITKRAITLVQNDNAALPLSRPNEKTVILTASSAEILSAEYALALLRAHGKLASGSDVRIYTYDGQSYESLCAKIGSAANVIAISEVKNASGLRSAKAQLIDRLIAFVHSKAGRFAVLSAHLPYDAARFTDADAVVLAYSSKAMNQDPFSAPGTVAQYGPNIPAALYMMFSAGDPPTAKVPVSIPKLDSAYYFTNETLYERGFGLTYSSSPAQPTQAPTQAPDTPAPSAAPGTQPPAATDAPAGETPEAVTAEPSGAPDEAPTVTPGTDAPADTPEVTQPGLTDAPGAPTDAPDTPPQSSSQAPEPTADTGPTPEPARPSPEPGKRPSPALIAAAAAAVLAVIGGAAYFVLRKK